MYCQDFGGQELLIWGRVHTRRTHRDCAAAYGRSADCKQNEQHNGS